MSYGPVTSMSYGPVTPAWLGLREAADAVARAGELVELLRGRLARTPLVIHDLGCGTGSMGRWLAPQLPGPQHWVMHDRDPSLLRVAAGGLPDRAGDGSAVTVDVRGGDVTQLTADDLRGAGLVTTSALLDLLTVAEVERIVAACCAARCSALLTLSVSGRVDLAPSDPMDGVIAAAFNAHQRCTSQGRRLLGPDALDATIDAFARHGVATVVRCSPWRLGPDNEDLMSEWLEGWLAAACEHQPELAEAIVDYARRRAAEMAARQLHVTVHHGDVLGGPE
jgi:hypothetical protein